MSKESINFNDDAELIAALRRGGASQNAATEYIFKAYFGFVTSLLNKQSYYRSLDPQSREHEEFDVFHVKIRSVLSAISKPGWKLETASFASYFYTALENEISSRGKKQHIEQTTSTLDPTSNKQSDNLTDTGQVPGPLSEIEMAEITDAINKLGEPCRSIITLEQEGYNSQEIADMLNERYPKPYGNQTWSAADVRAQKTKCKDRLRSFFKDL